jgi:hypothetical protein
MRLYWTMLEPPTQKLRFHRESVTILAPCKKK